MMSNLVLLHYGKECFTKACRLTIQRTLSPILKCVSFWTALLYLIVLSFSISLACLVASLGVKVIVECFELL